MDEVIILRANYAQLLQESSALNTDMRRQVKDMNDIKQCLTEMNGSMGCLAQAPKIRAGMKTMFLITDRYSKIGEDFRVMDADKPTSAPPEHQECEANT